MRRRILGTAGHIDHGKTALIGALTGVDTDRLREEKERGITIDLGFAPLPLPDGTRLGVVDVPGHEGFVRNMVAGATGVDLVLLVVAADEGVMPQTREHLAIVDLLGVERMVVALTKADLVEDEWLELVREEVRETLAPTPFRDAPLVATSVEDGRGLDELRTALENATAPDGVEAAAVGDLVRLPIDRVFTVRGTGTVVTGTLWSGRLREGDQVRILPAGLEPRVRGVQVHGEDVPEAFAGERTAVALAGPGIKKDALSRGDTLVSDEEWRPSSMLTVRLRVLADPGWSIERGQRVRVHLGTAEVMARCAPLEDEVLLPGREGWVQLRLESPVVARARDHLVVRAYSPVTTIAGGRVAEPFPPRRTRLSDEERGAVSAVLDGGPEEAVEGVLRLAGWSGVSAALLPVACGRAPSAISGVLSERPGGSRLLDPARAVVARERLLEAVDAWHESEPLRPGIPLERLRTAVPAPVPDEVVEAWIAELEAEGEVRVEENVAFRPGFHITLSREQEGVRERIRAVYLDAGLQPPRVDELPDAVADRPDLWPILKLLESDGDLVRLEEDLWVAGAELSGAARRTVELLGGREGLGPADFRPVLGVTRKHLLPILGHFDRIGITVRGGEGRRVAGELPAA